MISQLRRARKHYLCSCCHQLILPGELYRYQSWPPWEQEDGTHYWRDHACRWCADRYWQAARANDGLWAPEQDADEWRESELRYWLTQAGVDYKDDSGWGVQEVYTEPIRTAGRLGCNIWNQHFGRAPLLAFFRAIGLDPWAWQWRWADRAWRGRRPSQHEPTPGHLEPCSRFGCSHEPGEECWLCVDPRRVVFS